MSALSTTGAGHAPADRTVPRRLHWLWPDTKPWGGVTLFLLITGLYAVGSLPTQYLLRETGLAAALFIPAGITVAFLIRLPVRQWPVVLGAVALTEALMDLAAGYALPAIAGYVVANVAEPLLGAVIVRRACGSLDLARLRHLVWFLIGPVVIACGVGAAIGSLVPALMEGATFGTTLAQWWLGDGLGVVLVGGGILVWGSGEDRRTLASVWGTLLLVGTGVIMFFLARTGLPITFLILVGVVVAGALFGPRAVAMTSIVTAIAQVLETADGSGPLIAGVSDETALVTIKLRLLVYAVSGFVIAAEANEVRIAAATAAASSALIEAQLEQSQLERKVATRLQLALLPGKPIEHPYVEVAFRYESASEGLLVGGDWYDVFGLPKDRIAIAVGDVAGHGLEAAATMGRLRTAVSVLAPNSTSPGKLLDGLDEYAQGTDNVDFVTVSYSILDPFTDELRFASAGHPPLVVVSPSGGARFLVEGRSHPIGSPSSRSRADASTHLEPGSLLVAYSDGLVERRGEELRDGLNRLADALRDKAGWSPERVCDHLLEAMGVSQTHRDDVVVVVVSYKPGLVAS